MAKCGLTIRVLNARQQPFTTERPLVSLRRDNKTLVSRELSREDAGAIRFNVELDEQNNPLGVIVSARQHHQTGFFPVELTPDGELTLELILIHKSAEFQFPDLTPAKLESRMRGHWTQVLRAGSSLEQLRLNRSEAPLLACLLNVLAAMEGVEKRTNKELVKKLKFVELRARTPDEERDHVWKGLQQDRVFATADESLVDDIKNGGFGDAHESVGLHKPSDTSLKEEAYGEANLQFSFVTKREVLRELGVPEGEVLADIDLDLFRDKGAHVLLEVIPNTFAKKLFGIQRRTNPRDIYTSRAIAARFKKEMFAPPFDLWPG